MCDAPYDHPEEEAIQRSVDTAAEPEAESVAVSEAVPEAEPAPVPEFMPIKLSEPVAPCPADAEVSATSSAESASELATAFQPEWRREVVHRLEAYRARRRRNGTSGSQAELPFRGDNGHDEKSHADGKYRPSLRSVSRSAPAETPEEPASTRRRRAASERIEIPVMQPEFDFVLAPSDDEEMMHPHAPLVPVAEVRERSRAGMLDAMFLGMAYVAFLILFRALGGRFSLGKSEAVIYLTTFFLFYAVYFGLFTALGGTTPGMYFRGLTVVSFDGTTPGQRQLMWRSFGYVLSGGTLMLGFVWSLWDEDHLTWQDRVSQTYLTNAPSPMWHDLDGEEPAPFSSSPDDSTLPDAT